MNATGTFDITAWDVLATDEHPGATISRIHVAKTFHGDLKGTSTTQLQTVTTPTGPAAYTGIEHLTATLDGREGTIALQHSGGMDDNGRPWLNWLIIPGTGTGDLTGLRGHGQIINDDGAHSYTLEYDLG